MKEIDINIDDILLFYSINKKKDNDNNNRIRENIIYRILNNSINEEWYIKDEKWNEIRMNLQRVIIETDYIIELKGGRNCNYDFILKDNKNNDKYPQFLSINSGNFIKDDGYVLFFYDNYLVRIANLLNIKIPDKNEYIKYIYSNNYNSLSFFSYLKARENEIKNEKKKLVDESIYKYLKEKVILNIDEINKYFKEKEMNKYYLLYKNQKFRYDYIKEEELEVIEIKEIKNKNTLVLKTKSSSFIMMLLRWKNHLGILYPAWQISLIRK